MALAYPQVFCRSFSLICHFLVAHFVTLIQAAEASSFDRGDVHENILAAVVRLNEAETLRWIEPLNGTYSHVADLQIILTR